MAIIKKGKIQGRVGNYIYRLVNGVEIIQTYPRSIKTSEGTKRKHAFLQQLAGELKGLPAY